ncbi:MAG: PAS domain S-box protein [Thermodesulfobacteriota bacterium]|nr:PAS domain S-box protein [Thermodesulfobacteriota bacterium]
MDAQILNVAIVGGGPGCKAIMEIMFAEKLSQLRMNLIGVACTNPKAVGYLYAQGKGIYTTRDYLDLYGLEDLGMIIELTGTDEVAREIARTRPEHVRLMDHVSARLFWDVFQIEEQRLKDLKRAQDEVARSEKRYRDLYEGSRDGYAMVNMEGRIIEFNASFQKMLGYTEKELFDKTYEDITPRRWHSLEGDIFTRQVFKRGYSDVYEKEYKRKDGTVFPIEVRTHLFKDERGKHVGMWAWVRDITERKDAEQELLRITQAVESVSDAIGMSDPDGHHFYQNRAFTDLFEYDTAEELEAVGGGPALYKDHDVARAMFKEIMSGRSWAGEVEMVSKKGREFSILLRADSIKDDSGNIIGLVGVHTDITERKQAEEAMVRSKEDWENTFDAITEMVMLLDSEHRIIRLNRAAAEALHAPKESLVGKKCYEAVHRQNHPIRKCPLPETMKNLRPHTEEIVDPERGTTLICTTSPILDGEGELRGYTHSLKDITQSKRLEAQFQQAQKLEAIGTLAGGIAHDFNNLLMAIQGRISLMLMNLDSEDPNFGFLKGIEDAVKRGAYLSKQLLGFARGGKYEVKATDLNRLVEKSSEMFGRTKKEISIHKKYEKDIWPVEADQGQIEQVLLNLYVNAWQAMPGGGDLYLETKNVTLHRHYTKPFNVEPGNYVKVSLTDTGVGMDEATRQRIFEPFFTTKEMGGGTGLGLASSYGIIKNHGGIISVYSEPGHGTTFDIYMPASGKEPRKEKAPSEEILKGTETVLLVDDEDSILEVGKEMLSALGYKVILAASGGQALGLFKKNRDRIDMVVLDMVMPDIGGGEVYDQLKQIDPKVKVLLSSGYSVDGQANEILKRGCQGFIQKPFAIRELSSKLRQILET